MIIIPIVVEPVGLVGNRENAAGAAGGSKAVGSLLSAAFERDEADCAGFRQIDRMKM